MPGGGSNVYRFGPFELDAPRGCLFRGKTRVRLRESQFAILVYLVSHAGEVVAKDDLVNAAWRTAVTDNSLDQAISRLRKILGSGPGGTHYIDTVPNRGYRFAVPVARAHRYEPDASADSRLAPFRTFVRGQADLDTFDRDGIVRARRAFEDVLRETPDYAPAHIGLANACAFAYEATCADVTPDVASLQLAVDHALKACELEPASADAWSTRAFAACLNGDADDAEAAACKAVELDSSDWRHAMRLAYVSWGGARVRAAQRVLKLCPGLALAHYLMATVFVARQAFDSALEVLEDGCAAQDAQAATTSGYPAVALHLHHGRVLAAIGNVDRAIDELTRELDTPHYGQIYARECIAHTWYTIGALHQRQGRRDEAMAAFTQSLLVMPGHMCATAAIGGDPSSAHRRQDRHPIDVAMAQAVVLARAGRHRDAARTCADALAPTSPGPAGWLLPTEPMLHPTAQPDIWAPVLAILRTRAI